MLRYTRGLRFPAAALTPFAISSSFPESCFLVDRPPPPTRNSRPDADAAGDARFDAFRKKVTQAQASSREWPVHRSVRKFHHAGGRERGVLESEMEGAGETANRNTSEVTSEAFIAQERPSLGRTR